MNVSIGWYHLSALLIVMIWGLTFVSTKILLFSGLAPDDIFFYRFLLAYIGIWFFGKSRLFSKHWKDECIFLLLGITGGSLYFLTENYALHYTQASNVALLVSTAPLMTAILSHFFVSNERLNRNIIIGSFIALGGVALVVFNGQYILALNPWGDFLSLSAALCWAFYTILLKSVEKRYTTLFITRKIFFYGLLTILPVFWFKPLNINTEILFQPKIWSNLLFLGIGASLLCFFFWNLAVKKLGAIRTTNYVYIIPLITLVASSVIIHETITMVAIIGALLILAGIVLAERK